MRHNILVRLAAYYLTVFIGLAGFFSVFPEVLYEWGRERTRANITGFFGPGVEAVEEPVPDFPGSWDLVPDEVVEQLSEGTGGSMIAVALALAFALTMPMVWVYRWTHSGKKYQQSFAHSLVMLPIGIALVVFLVKDSLALAFCLAGIVAAVRYRASISQPLDAVYVLVAMGIGLASATQLIGAAFIGSIFFVALALTVWKTDFAAQPPVMSGWRVVPGAVRQRKKPRDGTAVPSDGTAVPEPE